MLNLPWVTLFAIDCVNPQLTLSAMRRSTRWVKFADMVLLTDFHKHQVSMPGVRVVHHEEGSAKVARPDLKVNLPVDYELAVMREPSQHVRTSHVLHIEWDSAVINHEAWDDRWLKYDFIGAPWPRHHDAGWPECTELNNVGNGGFSLKSNRFCHLVRTATFERGADPGMVSSDRWMCRTLRPWLESKGMVFAPEAAARRFSCENEIYTGQFGFHGKWTAELNGWGGTFFGPIRPK